jgi:hypothetical protein
MEKNDDLLIDKIHRQLVRTHTEYSETTAQPPLYICLLARNTSDAGRGRRKGLESASDQRKTVPIGERLKMFFASLNAELKGEIASAYICLSWETNRKGESQLPSAWVKPRYCKGEHFFGYLWTAASDTLTELLSNARRGAVLNTKEEVPPPRISCDPSLYRTLALCDIVQPYVLTDRTMESQDEKEKRYRVEILSDLIASPANAGERRKFFKDTIGKRLKSNDESGSFYQFTLFGYKLNDPARVTAFLNPGVKCDDASYYKPLGRWLHMAFILFVLQWNTSLVTANAEVLRERDDRIPYLPPGNERANLAAVLRQHYDWE